MYFVDVMLKLGERKEFDGRIIFDFFKHPLETLYFSKFESNLDPSYYHT